MKFKNLHISTVLSAALLFAVFTLMHQYDWLLPPSPVATVASTTSVPIPDVVEEHGGEDEIEHDDSKGIVIPKLNEFLKFDMIYGDIHSPRIFTPPPDLI